MGLGIFGLEFQTLAKIVERQLIFGQFIIGIAPVDIGVSIAGIPFDRRVVIFDGLLVLL